MKAFALKKDYTHTTGSLPFLNNNNKVLFGATFEIELLKIQFLPKKFQLFGCFESFY